MDEEEYVAFDDDAAETIINDTTKKKKLDKEGSKKQKKAKGIKKFKKSLSFAKIIIGGFVVYVAVKFLFSYALPEIYDLDTTKNINKETSAYSITITMDDNETLLLGDVDLGYFYIYYNNGKNELVRTSPHDYYIHNIYDNSIIEGLDVNSDELTPLYCASLIQDMANNGEIEKDGLLNQTYNITICQSELNELLSSNACGNELNEYTDINSETYENLSDYLDAVQDSKSKSK